MKIIVLLTMSVLTFAVFSNAEFETTAEAAAEFEEGTKAYSSGEFAEALIHFDKSLEYDPELYMATEMKALTYIAQGDNETAISLLSPMLQSFPDYANGWNNLALAYLNESMLAEAKSATESAIALDANFAEPHSTLGAVYLKKREYQLAIDEFKTAISLNPDLSDAYFSLGDIYRFQKEDKLAGDNYKIYLEKGGNSNSRRKAAIKFLFDNGRSAEVPH